MPLRLRTFTVDMPLCDFDSRLVVHFDLPTVTDDSRCGRLTGLQTAIYQLALLDVDAGLPFL